MITLREQFIRAFDAFVAHSGLAESTLSDRLLKSGSRFRRIRESSDISTATFERVMRWLSDNWPEGAEWPEGVERPKAIEPGSVPARGAPPGSEIASSGPP
jgi:hypothetical protein